MRIPAGGTSLEGAPRFGARPVISPHSRRRHCAYRNLFPALRLPAFLTPAPSLAVSCPAASLDIFGLPARWPYVFIAICLAEMFAFRKRFA